MDHRFGCKVQIKLYDGPTYISLDVRGVQDADSHAPEKERSKHLTVKQLHALHTGVRMSPTQSARSLRRNLANFSPEKQINPLKIRNVRRQVAKFRAQITREQLDNVKIDDSYDSLVRYTDYYERLILFWVMSRISIKNAATCRPSKKKREKKMNGTFC